MQVYCRVSSSHVCGMLEPDPEVWWCAAAVELESGVFVGVTLYCELRFELSPSAAFMCLLSLCRFDLALCGIEPSRH